MKTTWKFETVQAGRSGREEHEWLRAKQLDFEQKTGVAWSYESAHGMYIFNACMRAVDAQHADGDAADRIIAWMNTNGCWGLKYVQLLDISEGTGLPLTVVCGTCWALVKNQQLKVTVDRMGKPTAVALSR